MKDYTRYTLEVADVFVLRNLPLEVVDKLEGVVSHELIRNDSTPDHGEYHTISIRTHDNMDVVIDHLGLENAWGAFGRTTYNYPLGTWKCESSPYKVCVYDHETDPAHDFCLVCGHPDERK